MLSCKTCRLREDYITGKDPQIFYLTTEDFSVGLYPKVSYFLRSFITPNRHLGDGSICYGFHGCLNVDERIKLGDVSARVVAAIRAVGTEYKLQRIDVLTLMRSDLAEHPNLDLIPRYDSQIIEFEGESFAGKAPEGIILESFSAAKNIEPNVKAKLNELLKKQLE